MDMADGKGKSSPVLVTSKNASQLRPEILGGMAAFSKVLKDNRQLPDRLVELMRLRIAFRNQCRDCMSMRYASALDDGLTEDLVCSIERPSEPSDLNPQERAAVEFGDKFAGNHLSITAEDRLALNEHFTPEQIVELGILAAMFTGFGRFGAVFDTGDSLPVGDRRSDGSALTPWGINDPIIMGVPAS
jgi:AhpD family alkylhydroperoxidase